VSDFALSAVQTQFEQLGFVHSITLSVVQVLFGQSLQSADVSLSFVQAPSCQIAGVVWQFQQLAEDIPVGCAVVQVLSADSCSGKKLLLASRVEQIS
jgi:hypothetical protein